MRTLSFLVVLLFAGTAQAQNCIQTGPYPFVENDCLHRFDLNNALSMSPAATPPQNAFGSGANFGYIWMDTSTSPDTVRLCKKAPSCNKTYNAAEWSTLGTIDSTGGWTPVMRSGTGTPTESPKEPSCTLDITNSKIWCFVGGVWKSVQLN